MSIYDRDDYNTANITIDEIKKEFIYFLLDDHNSVDRIMNKYLLFGIPYIYKNDEELYFDLKEEISNHFNIQQTQIFVVGSAKLGFSIAPTKRFKMFDDDSDIDIAIIDSDLFDQFWKDVYTININLISRSEKDDNRYKKFVDYLFKGWIRPDLLPLKMRSDWFEYFKGLYGRYDRKIAVGIYRDHSFFMGYHRMNIIKLREDLKNGI